MITPLHLRITAVSTLLNEPTHGLRHWEREFAFWLRIERSKSGHRVYSQKNIERLREIQRLLREELLTTAGARKRMRADMAPLKAHGS